MSFVRSLVFSLAKFLTSWFTAWKKPKQVLQIATKSRQTAFTLIEVLVALFILAVISMSASQVINSQVNISQRHADYALSNLCASSLVANWQLESFYPPVGRQEGEIIQLGFTCFWRLDVSGTAIKNMESGVLRIFSDKDREKSIGKYDVFLGL